MQSTMMGAPLMIDHLLDRAGKVFPQVEVVSQRPDRSRHRYTYGEFHQRARALAEMLVNAGLKPGDRVATLMWNNYAHLEAYYGIPAAGGVTHTLNLRLHADEIAWIVNHAEDRFLIVDDVLLPLYEQFREQVNLERVLVVPFSGEDVPPGMESYEEFIGGASGDFSYVEKEETDAAAMCYTSGTTGRPKGVIYSHRSICIQALAAALPDAINLSFRDTALPVVPMFHANGWTLPYTAAMVGARQVLPGPHLDTESLLRLCQEERVTLTAGVPAIWLGVLQALDAEPERWKLPGLRVLSGGSAIPESAIRGFDRHGLKVSQGWGMTETQSLATTLDVRPETSAQGRDAEFACRARMGIISPMLEARIIDDNGNEAPWDGESVGELQVRGPWVTASYHKVPVAEDKFADNGEWLRTGDVATIDPLGYLRLVDRTKDLIKSGGEWISSVELENAIMSHPQVSEATVIAVPHEKWGERPLAVVVTRSGEPLEKATLDAFLEKRFARWMLPDDYIFTDEIPKTSTGKFSKKTVREQFGVQG
ncbi:MAG: long-chain fatty acid--CoA ligase [Ectothiorhodospiraceae bacterium]|nr:long-chain fatty acid--CoA ligase [Ectothiorhodospiraceae bacterium]